MARDLLYSNVREALTNDGWTITHDPYPLKEWDPDWEVDFGAEKLIAAEKDATKIAVEVKSFVVLSFAYEFHRVLGQYLNYRGGLKELERERTLYLAVPKTVYDTEFQRRGIRYSVEEYNIYIIVFDPLTNLIEQWIPAIN